MPFGLESLLQNRLQRSQSRSRSSAVLRTNRSVSSSNRMAARVDDGPFGNLESAASRVRASALFRSSTTLVDRGFRCVRIGVVVAAHAWLRSASWARRGQLINSAGYPRFARYRLRRDNAATRAGHSRHTVSAGPCDGRGRTIRATHRSYSAMVFVNQASSASPVDCRVSCSVSSSARSMSLA